MAQTILHTNNQRYLCVVVVLLLRSVVVFIYARFVLLFRQQLAQDATTIAGASFGGPQHNKNGIAVWL